MNLQVNTALEGLNATLADYAFLAKKLPEEVLAKQGTKLGFELANRLVLHKPGKGQVTADNLAALQSGARGVRVRPGLRSKIQDKLGLANRLTDRNRKRPQSVYGKSLRTQFVRKGKRLNFQALAVKAELSARERGGGYSAYVARVKGLDQLGAATAGLVGGSSKNILTRGRYNQLLASASLGVESDGASLTIKYGSSGTGAGDALSTPEATAAIVDSINAVTDDIGVYMTRKLQEVGR